MTLLRPNQILIFDLDERIDSEDTRLEIRRCYSFIGNPLIRTHAPEAAEGAESEGEEEEPIKNSVRLQIGLGTSDYLHSSVEGADELWRDVIEPSISNMLHKIGANMKAYNRRQRKIGLPEINVSRLDIVLQNGQLVIGMHPDATSLLGREQRTLVDDARRMLNDGTLAGAVRIDIPSDESYDTQEREQRAIWDEAHPAEEEPTEEELRQAAQDAAEEEYDQHLVDNARVGRADQEQGTDRFLDEKWLEEDARRKSYENTAVPPVDTDILPTAYHEPEVPEAPLFDFDLDYSVWSVTYEDGSVRTFDTTTATFVD